jgi:hypothetical protein
MLRPKLLAAIACSAVLFSAIASAGDHGRGHGNGNNDRGNWHQADGRWNNNGNWNNGRWNNGGYYRPAGYYRPVPRPVYVAPRYYGGYYPAPVYYGPPPVYYAPAPVYPYYPYGGYGYNRPSVTGSIVFSFPFHF